MELTTDIMNQINERKYSSISKDNMTDEIARYALHKKNRSYAVKDIKNYTIDDWTHACKLEGNLINYMPHDLDYDIGARAALQDHIMVFDARTVILSMANPTDNDWINAVMCDGLLCAIMPSHLKSDKIYSYAITSTLHYSKAIFLMEQPNITDWSNAVIRDKTILKKLPDEYKTAEFVDLCKNLQIPNINVCHFEINFEDNMITTTNSFNWMAHYLTAKYLMDQPNITDWANAVIRDKTILKKLPEEYKTKEFVDFCKKLQNHHDNIWNCRFEINFEDNMITTTNSFNNTEHYDNFGIV